MNLISLSNFMLSCLAKVN